MSLLFYKNCFGIKKSTKVDMPLNKETKRNLSFSSLYSCFNFILLFHFLYYSLFPPCFPSLFPSFYSLFLPFIHFFSLSSFPPFSFLFLPLLQFSLSFPTFTLLLSFSFQFFLFLFLFSLLFSLLSSFLHFFYLLFSYVIISFSPSPLSFTFALFFCWLLDTSNCFYNLAKINHLNHQILRNFLSYSNIIKAASSQHKEALTAMSALWKQTNQSFQENSVDALSGKSSYIMNHLNLRKYIQTLPLTILSSFKISFP